MHVCGGRVQSVSVIEKAAVCALEVKTQGCHKTIVKNKTCCKEDQITFEGKSFKSHELTSLHVQQAFLVIELPFLATITLSPSLSSEFQFLQYTPPLIDRDITVQVQSFLI